jgi:hypothetical protein
MIKFFNFDFFFKQNLEEKQQLRANLELKINDTFEQFKITMNVPRFMDLISNMNLSTVEWGMKMKSLLP